jgi:hypothetical protein
MKIIVVGGGRQLASEPLATSTPPILSCQQQDKVSLT